MKFKKPYRLPVDGAVLLCIIGFKSKGLCQNITDKTLHIYIRTLNFRSKRSRSLKINVFKPQRARVFGLVCWTSENPKPTNKHFLRSPRSKNINFRIQISWKHPEFEKIWHWWIEWIRQAFLKFINCEGCYILEWSWFKYEYLLLKVFFWTKKFQIETLFSFMECFLVKFVHFVSSHKIANSP